MRLMGEMMSQAKVIRPELTTADRAANARRVVNFEAEYFLNALIAFGALIFLAPLMLAVALAVHMQDRGPIFFAHRRIGRDGRAFPCFKFRSMAVDAEARLADLLARDPAARAEWTASHKLKVDPRVTKLGDFLRRSSLDELPQLFNVLRGEMSLVGPRPVVHAESAHYGHWFDSYCSVRPGITGLWQVSGRSDVSYRQRVALDVLYVRRKCLAMDFGILVQTVPAVFLRRGSC
jgi:exopolysaccharide production protein ExoY